MKEARTLQIWNVLYDIVEFVVALFAGKQRKRANRALALEKDQTILNLPCGTGQNPHYLQPYLNGTGKIIGVDLSSGMLQKVKK